VEFNSPGYFFLGLGNIGLITIEQHSEELWINLEVIIARLKMSFSTEILVVDLFEPFP
jgi:hypothetical protein